MEMQMPTRSRYAGNGTARRKVRERVLAAYDTCAICGLPVDKHVPSPDPLSPEVDEIVPVKMGGSPLRFDNCQLAHRCCNRWRSTKSMRIVSAISSGVYKVYGRPQSPVEFVRLAKIVEKGLRRGSFPGGPGPGEISTSREW